MYTHITGLTGMAICVFGKHSCIVPVAIGTGMKVKFKVYMLETLQKIILYIDVHSSSNVLNHAQRILKFSIQV